MTVAQELHKLEDMCSDLAATHKKEVAKAGKRMDPGELEARREVMEAISTEFRDAFKHAKGYAHAADADGGDGAVGINVITRKQLEAGTYAGAGLKTKREELTGEQMQTLAQIHTQTAEQDAVLDEISKGLDELKEIAEKMNDVRGAAGWGGWGARFYPILVTYSA